MSDDGEDTADIASSLMGTEDMFILHSLLHPRDVLTEDQIVQRDELMGRWILSDMRQIDGDIRLAANFDANNVGNKKLSLFFPPKASAAAKTPGDKALSYIGQIKKDDVASWNPLSSPAQSIMEGRSAFGGAPSQVSSKSLSESGVCGCSSGSSGAISSSSGGCSAHTHHNAPLGSHLNDTSQNISTMSHTHLNRHLIHIPCTSHRHLIDISTKSIDISIIYGFSMDVYEFYFEMSIRHFRVSNCAKIHDKN